MPDFSRRDTTPELMDHEEVPYEEHRAVLRQLTRANELSLAYRPTLAFFRRLKREGRWPKDRPLVVVDAASGYGDMSRKVDRWARKNGLAAQFLGVDMNPRAARAAAEATPPSETLTWITANLFDFRPDLGVDIVMSSLFTHHLPGPELVRFIRWMEDTARIGWIVNDLERHPLPYYFLKAVFFATRRHRFMRHDGPVSVASAFKREDWQRLLAEAGLAPGATSIESWTPFRLCVTRIRDAAA
ncbi:methyltransferase domain-containing protein [Rhodomicrobium sp. Az07]|uniref:methyltransferase domain-containing protein n=1 Tax=Rhodomicrobium sp. Az07 TaxID=2839034 RepID=UPI001BEC0E92|nr:methyltransferase domain-containing protein [Rhodomicrobium sp. Az07]MBT3070813.1 methyltransferase domain-containing protein [Rhodomicrobium sp. Az07]